MGLRGAGVRGLGEGWQITAVKAAKGAKGGGGGAAALWSRLGWWVLGRLQSRGCRVSKVREEIGWTAAADMPVGKSGWLDEVD